MAGREDHAAARLVLADQMGGGRGGEDAAGGGDQPGHAVGGGHAGDHADGAAVAVAAVAAHHQGAAGHAGQHPQAGLDEALQVVGRLELLAALAQARGARFLVAEGGGKADLARGHGNVHSHGAAAERIQISPGSWRPQPAWLTCL